MTRCDGQRKYVIWALGAMIAGGFWLTTGVGTASAQDKAKVEAAPAAMTSAQALSESFRAIAKKAKPAVVSITVRAMTEETSPKAKRSLKGGAEQEINPEDLPEPLRDLFKKEFRRRGGGFEQRPPALKAGMGSGVIIDAKNGYILTNNHVVDIAKDEKARIDVRLSDGTTNLLGKVVGLDPAADLALVQIKTEGHNLTELPLGESEKMEVGDLVMAIGAPFNLTQTVTQGIVSATGRGVGIVEGYEDFIQTDAAINPGNSGGPLLNMRGEIIGINTAIVTNGVAAGYMGVGFAVPSATVKEMIALWKQGKQIVRGYLGVEIKGIKEAFEPGAGKAFGLSEDKGILVENTKPGTPAAKAGLKGEDVILSYDGKDVGTVAELQRQVARTAPGTKVDLKVWRDGKEITIPVTIEKQPANYFHDQRRSQRGGKDAPEETEESGEVKVETLGMTVGKLTPELAKQYGWDDSKELSGASVIVTEVEPLGEAGAGLGIHAGDLILSVQGKTMKSPEDLREALSTEALNEGVRLRIKDAETHRTRTLFGRTPK